jgi:hypothetical protein
MAAMTARARRRSIVLPLVVASAFGLGRASWAGPPYLTDDPEPVPPGHWEVYVATQWTFLRGEATGQLPLVDVNYGFIPGVHLHVMMPAVLELGGSPRTAYGPGDLELGAKMRFVDEGERQPQIAFYPLVTLPSGSSARGLGAGEIQVFLPLWIQKGFGPWTTYGGGGASLERGKRDVAVGWVLQRRLGERVAVGVEAFALLPLTPGPNELHLDAGLVVDVTENHHVLLSGGPAFGGFPRGQAYASYQLTF